MSIKAEAKGEMALLLEDTKIILKAYPSPDGTTLRIVFPELKGQKAGDVKYFFDSEGLHYVQVRRPK